MNDRVQSIIKSDEAKKMRQMVTMGFYDRSDLALWLFEVIGREYDEMAEWSQKLAYEAFPQTCTLWSIDLWEFLYGIESNDHLDINSRRQKVHSKKLFRLPMNPAQIEKIIHTLTGCYVEVVENVADYTFRVEIRLPGTQTNLNMVIPYLKEIKPSHLSMEVVYLYNTWDMLKGLTWEQAKNKTWYKIKEEVL